MRHSRGKRREKIKRFVVTRGSCGNRRMRTIFFRAQAGLLGLGLVCIFDLNINYTTKRGAYNKYSINPDYITSM